MKIHKDHLEQMSRLAGIETDMMLTGFNCELWASGASPLGPLTVCPVPPALLPLLDSFHHPSSHLN